ncbi:glycoside hydrolase family 15 protein [Sorangium sp. So ce375]|uniref:glycoside hydrolase family 15 protein n=1 Tax=Sorangium sp. So ce375 TaxID=3133306 RepID=UPI003F5CBC39
MHRPNQAREYFGHQLSGPPRASRALRSALLSLGAAAAVALAAPHAARAEAPVQRTFFRLPSSNGFGAVLLDLGAARLTHFREHLFATEEPLLDERGEEVWLGNQPQAVPTRDLLYDAYFGLRSDGHQRWLTEVPVDLDASGYAGWTDGQRGGTGVVTMVQRVGNLECTQFFFAPQGLPQAGFVMAMRVENLGERPAEGVSAFSLHNFHLGFGRPGVMVDIGESGETVAYDASPGRRDFLERAFAGVVVARALEPPAHHGASSAGSPPDRDVYRIVADDSGADLPDLDGAAPTSDGSVSAFQWDLGSVGPGEARWVGVAFAHHGDPSGAADPLVRSALDAYLGAQGAAEVVADEIAAYRAFQGSIRVPPSASPEEAVLLRQSAVTLRMAQSRESHAFLREHLTRDLEPRATRFGTTLGGAPATLPATVAHRGHGAVLASLPPGEWTVAWIRDGAYATVAMAALGMQAEARDALRYYLDAEAGRFQGWSELASYDMPPYQISLVRYYGFGVEETDFNDFGPNLEFDGFGLFLWALRQYEQLTGDTGFVDERWATASTKVADALVALIDPDTGLVRKDSSIWETHWKGRERSFAYTSITAARGLCDAAAIAERRGEADRAAAYRGAAERLRAAIAARLTDASGALAASLEELASGAGYWDAAVIEGIAMGLFDPRGRIAAATLAGLDEHLRAPAGAGWSRNDDRTDHAGADDLSPWGSEYDSAEWVVTDLRGAVAVRLMGDAARSDRLLRWVLDQSAANYLAIAETYDEIRGTYKFNAPMVGFGAGVYALALAARDGIAAEPACGAYFDESAASGGGAGGSPSSGDAGGAGAAGGSSDGGNDSGGNGNGGGGGDSGSRVREDAGCGCRLASSGQIAAPSALAAAVAAAGLARRRRRRARR